jgi:hypothetical protein
MKLFSDSNYQNEISLDDEITFGVVPAGSQSNLSIYILNDEKDDRGKFIPIINIKVSLNNPEITILSSPTSLPPQGKAKIDLQWNASLDLRQGLKSTATSININGEGLCE